MKSKQKVNLPVIALDTGRIVGRVERLLLSPTEKKATHLLIGEGKEGPAFLLPFSHVVTMGCDTLVIRSADGLLSEKAGEEVITGAITVVNEEIRGAGGAVLGRALEYTIDDKTGALLTIDCFDYELREKTGIEAHWLADDLSGGLVLEKIADYRKRWFPAQTPPPRGGQPQGAKKTAEPRNVKKQALTSYEMAVRKIVQQQNELRHKISSLAQRQLAVEQRIQDFAFGRMGHSYQEDLQIKIGALLDRQLSLEEVIRELSGEVEQKIGQQGPHHETRQKVSQLGERLQGLEKSVQEIMQAIERHAETFSRREESKRNLDALSVRLLTLERIQQELSANMSESNETYATKQEETQAQVDLFLNRQLALEKQQQELSERIDQKSMDAAFQEQMQQTWDALSERLLSMEKQQQEMYENMFRDRKTLEDLNASLTQLRAMAAEQAKKDIAPVWEPSLLPVEEDPMLTLHKLQKLKEERLRSLREGRS